MIQFHLRSSQIITVYAQVGSEEALQVALALDCTADRRVFLIGMGDELKRFTPTALVRHIVIQVLQMVQVDIMVALIFFQHKLVVLFTHVVVGDSQDQTGSAGSCYRQHTVIKQQAGEYLRIGDFSRRESGHQRRYNLSFIGNFSQNSLTVTVQTIQTDQLLQLVVVRTGVRIDH